MHADTPVLLGNCSVRAIHRENNEENLLTYVAFPTEEGLADHISGSSYDL